MKRIVSLVAGATLGALVVSALPATAQYANEFAIAKVVKQGTSSHPIAGSGEVEVKVQVNADGTHKVIGVLKSTNSGDNDAAVDIANTSTYRPAKRGTTPVTTFYTFRLKFSGKSVASNASEGTSSSSGGGGGIEGLIRAQKYDEAKRQAQMMLLSSPGNDHVRQLLGVAAYYSNDYETSAQAFARVASVDHQFAQLAAQALGNAAINDAPTNPTQAMTFAQKAVALDSASALPQLAMGVAQLANKQTAQGIATLKTVHDKLFAVPTTDVKVKIGIDSRLMQAYLDMNDAANADAIGKEMKQLDPTSTLPSRVLGNHYLQIGSAAQQQKKYPDAIKAYEQAASYGDPEVSVTAYASAAFALLGTDKPDFSKVKGYADKALAIKADSPEANYAEGIALLGSGDKSKAKDTLAKAVTLARAQGNEALALQIEAFIKNNVK